jgi:hypothetical protein
VNNNRRTTAAIQQPDHNIERQWTNIAVNVVLCFIVVVYIIAQRLELFVLIVERRDILRDVVVQLPDLLIRPGRKTPKGYTRDARLDFQAASKPHKMNLMNSTILFLQN